VWRLNIRILTYPIHQSVFLTSTIPSYLIRRYLRGVLNRPLPRQCREILLFLRFLLPTQYLTSSVMPDSHYARLSDDGNSRGAEIVAIGIVFTTMAAILVSLRFFARFIIIRSPGWDDFLIFCSMATSIALTALTAKRT
jgi:hypothetical protein